MLGINDTLALEIIDMVFYGVSFWDPVKSLALSRDDMGMGIKDDRSFGKSSEGLK